jgi:hypothetical protein
MFLAEALAARKDALTEIDGLRERIVAAATRYEDDDVTGDESAVALLSRLEELLTQVENLSLRINHTNNRFSLDFEGHALSLVAAIALRDRLLLEQRVRKAVVEGLATALGHSRHSYERRTKDEIRRVTSLKPAEMQAAANAVAARIRRLDLAMQHLNWSTTLVD